MKKYLDYDSYGYILNKLVVSGITLPVIKLARKMDFDLIKLFNDKIINSSEEKKEENINVVSKNLFGIVGNYIAYSFYLNKGYNVSVEYPLYDIDGNLLTKADIAFIDNNNNFNLCEVKTAFQIISNDNSYLEIDEMDSYSKKKELIKYKEIGKKLCKQVEKLSDNNSLVNVTVFKNCNIDNDIKSILKDKKVKLNIIPIDVYELFYQTKKVVEKIYNDTHKKTYNTSLIKTK